MDNPFISHKLIDIYHLIIDKEISISHLNTMLDEKIVSQAKLNRDSLMPLIGATYKGNIDFLEFLITHEMYSNLSTEEALTLLRKSGDADNVAGFNYLLKSLNIFCPLDINTTFERCCTLGCKNMVEYLLHPDQDWKIDIKKTNGLLYASQHKRKEIVEYLLNNGADVSSNNYVVVSVAFGEDNLDMLHYFLFERNINLGSMKECLSKIDIKTEDKNIYSNFMQVVDNAILTKALTQNLTKKHNKSSIKI